MSKLTWKESDFSKTKEILTEDQFGNIDITVCIVNGRKVISLNSWVDQCSTQNTSGCLHTEFENEDADKFVTMLKKMIAFYESA